jgi:hypothetical protein
MENICQAGLTQTISKKTQKQIFTNSACLNEPLIDLLNEIVNEWGVEVESVALVNSTKARTIRLMGEM